MWCNITICEHTWTWTWTYKFQLLTNMKKAQTQNFMNILLLNVQSSGWGSLLIGIPQLVSWSAYRACIYYYYYAKCENVNISEDENCFCKAYISTNIFRMIMVQKNLQATKFRERGVLRYPWPETFVGNRPSSNSVEMIIAIIFIFIYGYWCMAMTAAFCLSREFALMLSLRFCLIFCLLIWATGIN